MKIKVKDINSLTAENIKNVIMDQTSYDIGEFPYQKISESSYGVFVREDEPGNTVVYHYCCGCGRSNREIVEMKLPMYADAYYEEYLDMPEGMKVCEEILSKIRDAHLEEEMDEDQVIEIY